MSVEAKPSPWLQAGRLAFLALYAVTLLVALRWASSNVQQVQAQQRAVVVRLGAIHRVQDAGLLWALPPPFEQVLMLPSNEAMLELDVKGLQRSSAARAAEMSAADDDEAAPLDDSMAGSGLQLTGDSGIVQLQARVYYQVVDARAYVLQREHVAPALDRLVTRVALAACAARDLDTILVARPELVGNDSSNGGNAAEQRERLRGELVQKINRGLAALREHGADLGIEVARVDVQSSLPQATVSAFNAVATATQQAERNIAEARSDAAWRVQQATQNSDRQLEVAQAEASERVAKARNDTAAILQLAQAVRDGTDPGLLQRVYRERIGAILAKAGSVNTVPPGAEPRLILPAAE